MRHNRKSVRPLMKALALGLALGLIGCQGGNRLQPERLQDPDPYERLAAVDDLADNSSHEALDLLLAATRDPTAEVALAAVTALGDRGDVRAVPRLVATLTHPDADIGFAAEEALLKIGPMATGRLTASLDPRQPASSARVAEVLGRLGDPDAVPALITAISPPFPEGVNIAAVAALGQLGDARAAAPLVAALADRRSIVPYTATAALLGIGQAAVPPLIERLDDTDPDVAGMAAETLGRLGDARAVAPLVARLGDRENDAVRMTAATALGRIGDPRAVGPLITTLSDEFAVVRRKASEALVRIGPGAVAGLVEELASPDADQVVRVCDILGAIGAEGAVDPLVVTLDGARNQKIRLAAINALGRIQSVDALPRLRTLILGPDPALRDAAVQAAGAIGQPAVAMLVPLLASERQAVQSAAARGLIAVGGPAVDAVAGCLPDLDAAGRRHAADILRRSGPDMIAPTAPLLGHPDPEVRRIAAELLTGAGEEALPVLRTTLASGRSGLARRAAADALGAMTDYGSVDVLVRALMDSEASGHAARALRQLGWQPESDRDKVRYFVAVDDRIALEEMAATVRQVLMTDLLRQRGRYAAYALTALLDTQGEAVVPELAALLKTNGTRALANAYSASGQPQLVAAAAAWQAAHP
jgi:HEAT repeat protein